MSAQKDRDEFVSIMTAEGMPLDVIQALLRAERTLHRIAERECSDESADRDHVRCPAGATTYARRQAGLDSCLCRDYGSYEETETGGWHGTVPRIAVQAARFEARLAKMIAGLNAERLKAAAPIGAALPFGLTFNSDPRGPAILVTVPSGRTNDWGKRGICVP